MDVDEEDDTGLVRDGDGFRTEVLPDGRILVLRKMKQVLPNGEEYDGEFLENRRHGRGVLTKPNGTKYVGDFVDGLFHGHGTLSLGKHRVAGRLIVGWKYVGSWKGGKREGEGLWVSGEGDVYEGEWRDDRFHGHGREQKRSGDVYEGGFVVGMRHGEGELRLGTGGVYKGGFMKGQYHGEGEMIYPRGGGSYVGTFRLGKRHGIGKRKWATGGSYEGEWKDDFPSGRGVYRAPNGDVYVGDFDQGVYHGHGTLQWAHGDRYVGQFQRGQPCGVGRMDYQAGGFYEGEFWALARTGVKWKREDRDEAADDDIEGEGGLAWKHGGGKVNDPSELVTRKKKKEDRLRKMYDHQRPLPKGERMRLVMQNRNYGRILVGSDRDDPEKFKGIVRPVADGKRHGRGLRVWLSGARYEGDWYQDEMHGFGIYIGAGATAERYEGQFRYGKRSGRGVCSYGNTSGGTYVCPLGRRLPGDQRSIYDGEWDSNLFHGTGKFIWGDGRSYVGGFRKGQKHGYGVEVFLTTRDVERELSKEGADVRMVHRLRQYEGLYENGVREGRGKATMATGDVIEGNFIFGRLNGPCRYTFASGRISYAMFEMGHRKRWLRGEELEATLSAEAAMALLRGDTLSTEALHGALQSKRAERQAREEQSARQFNLNQIQVGMPHDPVSAVGTGSLGKRALSRQKSRVMRTHKDKAQQELRQQLRIGEYGPATPETDEIK